MSAWLIPALTRQWQDQQRARELKAAIVTRIGRDTTDALVVSSFIANGRFEPIRRPGRAFRLPMKVFNDLDLNWEQDRREIEAQLEAYFPGTDILRDWRLYAQLVRDTYWLITDREWRRDTTIDNLQERLPQKYCNIESLRIPFQKPSSELADSTERKGPSAAAREKPRAVPSRANELESARRPCTGKQLENPRSKYFFVASELLQAKSSVTDEILRADPEGLSTDASDFLQDLIPFL